MTPRWRQIYDFIEQYQREKGLCPTQEEVADFVGLTKQAIRGHLERMSKAKIVTREYGDRRGIKLNPEHSRTATA